MREQGRTEKRSDAGVRDEGTFSKEHIAFIESLEHLECTVPVKIKHFLVILCLRGNASFSIDGRRYDMQANDLLICHPDLIVEQNAVGDGFEFRCIRLSREYVQRLSLLSGSNLWSVWVLLEAKPLLHLTEKEAGIFCQYYDLIRSKLTDDSYRRHQKELVDILLLAFIWDFRNLMERFASLKPVAYTSGQTLFKDFLGMLSSAYPRPRMVSAYADRLCVTPKYLSAVCKQLSGYTASELINRYVVKDIVYLLRLPDRSIKDIAFELDFPNLSFFGKYVKKHLGMSPKQYRKLQK